MSLPNHSSLASLAEAPRTSLVECEPAKIFQPVIVTMILTWFRVVIYPTQMIASRRGFWPMRTDVGQWPLTLDLELSSFVSFKSNVLFIHGLREWLRRADERCDSPPLSLEWRQSSAGRTQPNKYGDCRHLHLKKRRKKGILGFVFKQEEHQGSSLCPTEEKKAILLWKC